MYTVTVQLSSLGVLSFGNKQSCGDLDQHFIIMVRLDLRRVINETLMSSSEICCLGLVHLLHPHDTQLKKQEVFLFYFLNCTTYLVHIKIVCLNVKHIK